jgi:hypothetical protein
MKKLIAISVVFALIAGAAFAVDIGGTVIGSADVIKGDTGKDANGDANKVTSGGGMGRIRLEGAGEAGDGNFGGWIRFDPRGGNNLDDLVAGNAWWKPIDQFKLSFGGNPDGIWGKEGVTGWGFTGGVTDSGVVLAGDNVWSGSIYSYGIQFRDAFFGGFGDNRVFMTISPAEIADINIGIPFMAGGEAADVFKRTIAQVDLKLDFGNIALTYAGGTGKFDLSDLPEEPDPSDFDPTDPDYLTQLEEAMKNYQDALSKVDYFGNASKIYVYFNLGMIENLSLDIGFGYTMPVEGNKAPMAIGLGVKYDISDAFGIKFRTVATLAGDDKATKVLADVLPFYAISDTMKVAASIGIGMWMPDGGDSILGWHFNPYIEVGSGPCFYAGVKAWSDGIKDAEDKTTINWAIPIGLIVSF